MFEKSRSRVHGRILLTATPSQEGLTDEDWESDSCLFPYIEGAHGLHSCGGVFGQRASMATWHGIFAACQRWNCGCIHHVRLHPVMWMLGESNIQMMDNY